MSRTTHHVPWRRRVDSVAMAEHGCRGPLHCGLCRRLFGSSHTWHSMGVLTRRRPRSGDVADVNESGEVAVASTRAFASYSYGRAYGFPRDAAEQAEASSRTRRRERDLLRMTAREATTLLSSRDAEASGEIDSESEGGVGLLDGLDGWLPRNRRPRQ